jgi:hypothetical protein
MQNGMSKEIEPKKSELRIRDFERLQAEVGKSRILEAVYQHIIEQSKVKGPGNVGKIDWNLNFDLHFGMMSEKEEQVGLG